MTTADTTDKPKRTRKAPRTETLRALANRLGREMIERDRARKALPLGPIDDEADSGDAAHEDDMGAPAATTSSSTTASITAKKPDVTWLKVSMIRSWVTTAKLFSCSGLSPRLARRAVMTSSCASRLVALSVGSTEMSIQPRQ